MDDFDVSSLNFEHEKPDYDFGSLELNLDNPPAASSAPVKAVKPVAEAVKPLAVGVSKGVMGKVAMSLGCSMLAGAIWNSPMLWQGIKWTAYIVIKTAGPPAGSEKLEKTEPKPETPIGKAKIWLEKHAPKPVAPVVNLEPEIVNPAAAPPIEPPAPAPQAPAEPAPATPVEQAATLPAEPPVAQPTPAEPGKFKLPPVSVLKDMKERKESLSYAPMKAGMAKAAGKVGDTVKEEAEKIGDKLSDKLDMLGPRNARRYNGPIPTDVMTRYGGDGPPVFGNDGVPVLRRIPGPARDGEEERRQQLIMQAERAGIEWDGRSKSDVEEEINKAYFKNAPNARCPYCKVALKLPPDSRERRRCKWCRGVYSVPTAIRLGPPPTFNAPIWGRMFGRGF